MKEGSENKEKKIDGNAIVSPKNTKRLYGNKRLDQDEAPASSSEDSGITLPDGTDENMFPSAP
jgi:hypothetical protein